jgi:ABC-type branched-subunit amino acid transport system substrate-binding protein
MRRILAAFAVIPLLATFALLRTAGAAPAPITIGFINHLSGDISLYGQSSKNGVDLAVDEINQSGGINGQPLQVEYLDDASQINQAVAGAHRAIQENVPFAFGSSASSFTLAIAPLFEAANAVSTNPKLANVGQYFFALMPGDDEQGAAWVDAAKKLHVSEAAVVYINNDYGNGVKDIFVKDFTAAGGKILGTIPVAQGGTDFRTDVLKLRDLKPRYTFFANYTKEGSLFLKQAHDLGFTTQYIGDSTIGTDDLIKADGDIINGFYALSVGQKDHPRYAAFAKAFEAKYHEKPTIWSDFAYDSILVGAEGLRRAGTNSQKLDAWLHSVHGWQGATGVVTFNEHGIRQGSHAFTLSRDVNGQWAPQGAL